MDDEAWYIDRSDKCRGREVFGATLKSRVEMIDDGL